MLLSRIGASQPMQYLYDYLIFNFFDYWIIELAILPGLQYYSKFFFCILLMIGFLCMKSFYYIIF